MASICVNLTLCSSVVPGPEAGSSGGEGAQPSVLAFATSESFTGSNMATIFQPAYQVLTIIQVAPSFLSFSSISHLSRPLSRPSLLPPSLPVSPCNVNSILSFLSQLFFFLTSSFIPLTLSPLSLLSLSLSLPSCPLPGNEAIPKHH